VPKVLILGDDTRSFLTSVRSFGRRGIEVHAVPDDWSAPALTSRYIHRLVRLPHYNLGGEAWADAMAEILGAESYDLVLPCNDQGILPLHQHRARFADTRLAIVDAPAIDIFFDKHLTRQLALESDVPVAPGRRLEAEDSADSLAKEFGLPLAVKPRQSFVLDNLQRRRSVVLCRSLKQLATCLTRIGTERDQYIVEGFFQGYGTGVSVLAHQGRLLQIFQHRRVREPAHGGGSSYRRAVPVDPRLAQATARLAEAARLTGLAMFEYRLNDAHKDFILLEVNARLWGSVPLPVAAGIDFPWLYYRLMVEGVTEPRRLYDGPVYARNLRNDINGLVDEVSELRLRGLARSSASIAAGVAGYWRRAAKREACDTFAEDDPKPGETDLRQLKASVRERLAIRLPQARRRTALAERARLAERLSQPGPLRLCFLCHGNICRSPFAERLARRKLADVSRVEDIFSVGTLPFPGRPSPAPAQAVARHYEVDLTDHRSVQVTQEPFDRYSLVFHFDPQIEDSWHRQGWGRSAHLFNLAHLIDPPERLPVIADPVDGDEAVFKACYAQIDRALDRLVAMMAAADQKIARVAGQDSTTRAP